MDGKFEQCRSFRETVDEKDDCESDLKFLRSKMRKVVLENLTLAACTEDKTEINFEDFAK